VCRVISDVALFHTGGTAGTAVAALAAATSGAAQTAGRIYVDAYDEIAHLDCDITAIAAVLAVCAARSRLAVPAGQTVSRMIVAIPMVLPVDSFQPRGACVTCRTGVPRGTVDTTRNDIWHGYLR
jgi:hypothetical protein